MCSCKCNILLNPLSPGVAAKRQSAPNQMSHARLVFGELGSQTGFCRHARIVRASEKEEEPAPGSDSTESLFLKELQRRGLTSASRDEGDTDRPSATSTSTQQPQAKKMEDNNSQPRPAPRSRSQLEQSRALGSEGFEGIIPRLTALGKLGLTFFLAFGPLILITVALFGGVYALFGEEFIHGGRSSHGIPYVNPYDLLDEPTVDPMVPFN